MPDSGSYPPHHPHGSQSQHLPPGVFRSPMNFHRGGGGYSPVPGPYRPQPDFYGSLSYPAAIGNSAHQSRLGPTLSFQHDGTESKNNHAEMQTHTPSFESNGSHSVPQMIGKNMASGPDMHSHPTPGYEYPYSAAQQQYPTHHQPPPPFAVIGPSYPYYHPHPHQQWSMMSAPIVSVEYITDIQPEDVLSGRGGATNSYSGNRAFRALVKEYQEQYLEAKKRDKPAVASIIVELIRKKGGRFLRRCNDKTSQGQILWVDIGDDRAREKTCQALREGAPAIRRKHRNKLKMSTSRSSSFDEEEEDATSTKSPVVNKDAKPTLSSPSSIDRTHSTGGGSTKSNNSSKGVRWSSNHEGNNNSNDVEEEVNVSSDERNNDGPIRIRPWAKLLPRRAPVEPIDLDQLSADDRDVYLRDFLPPCPSIRRKSQPQQQAPEEQSGHHGSSASPLPPVLYDEYGGDDHPVAITNDTTNTSKTGAAWNLLTA